MRILQFPHDKATRLIELLMANGQDRLPGIQQLKGSLDWAAGAQGREGKVS